MKKSDDTYIRVFEKKYSIDNSTEITPDDILSEVYKDLQTALGRFNGNAKFSTYLYSIARNKYIDLLRKSGGRETTINYDNAEQIEKIQASEKPEKEAEQRNIEKCLLKAMESLSDEHKEIILSFHLEEKSIKECATELDISENTVKTRLFYAKKNLKNTLAKHGITSPFDFES